jgi:hypothetical protein
VEEAVAAAATAYSVYVLYWYKSTNTDAEEGAAGGGSGGSSRSTLDTSAVGVGLTLDSSCIVRAIAKGGPGDVSGGVQVTNICITKKKKLNLKP